MKLFHNGMSVCAQKVRLVLAEKQIAYESLILDLQKGDQFAPEYTALNPGKVVPTLVDQGQVYCESSLINEYLEDAYPEIALAPADPAQHYTMRRLVKQIDDQVHQSCGVITYAIALRSLMLDKPAEELEAMTRLIPDPVRRQNRRLVLQDGIHAEPFLPALQLYLSILAGANTLLESSRWCAGETFSLADCALLPYVLRLDHLQLLPLLSAMPQLLRWYQAVQQLPCYQRAIVDQLPEKPVALFERCGLAVNNEIAAMVSAAA